VQAHRGEPDLGAVGIAFDMDVRRLGPIASVEETAEGPDAKNRGHRGKTTGDRASAEYNLPIQS
jgi:hypothetical protein